ncbi:MAG: DUF364 domain-containing protein [Desulfobacteraceae bacterium]
MIHRDLRKRLLGIAQEKGFSNQRIKIEMHVLKPTEAIGTPERPDFPLLKGKEFLMQATFMGAKGQAYTDAPSEFSGALKDILSFQCKDPRERGLFIASLNAVMKYVHPDLGTVHCKNNEPEACAHEIRTFVHTIGVERAGLIGLQPAILESMVTLLGADKVLCIDRDEDNLDLVKYGVPIQWGDDNGLEAILKGSDVILATGSSVANGSLDEILEASKKHNKPVYFYGTTIAGTAKLLGLNRLCFRSN